MLVYAQIIMAVIIVSCLFTVLMIGGTSVQEGSLDTLSLTLILMNSFIAYLAYTNFTDMQKCVGVLLNK